MRSARFTVALWLAAALLAPLARADVDITETLAQLDAQLAVAPTDPGLWQRRAAIERRRGNLERATADLARAGALGLAPALLERDRGLLLLDAKRPGDAEAALRSARQRTPEDVTVLLPHARALAALGRWREAADTYAEVLRLAPDASPDIHLERARTLGGGGPAMADEALASLDEALVRLGPVPSLQQAAVDIELGAGRTDAALARLGRTAAATKRAERLLLQRAEILERAGRQGEAAAAYGATLAAMESLPPQRRATPAAAEIEERARAGIVRIATKTEPRKTASAVQGVAR